MSQFCIIEQELSDEVIRLGRVKKYVDIAWEDIESHLRKFHDLDKAKNCPNIFYCMQDANLGIEDATRKLKEASDLMYKFYKPKSE